MLKFRIQKHCDDLLLCFREGFLKLYELSAAGQRLTLRGRSRACTNKMASASATPSSRYLQLIEGNSEGEYTPVPSTIARDRSLESTSGNYKRRENSDTTRVPLYERVKRFPCRREFDCQRRKLFL